MVVATSGAIGGRPDAEGSGAGEAIVVVAASAGGLRALQALLRSLPADFPAPIAIVQHRGPQMPDLLTAILSSSTALRVCTATEGCQLEPGVVYVCPPGVHMTAGPVLRVMAGPRLNSVRPSADLMLQSVARTYGKRAIAVVLSGTGTDGAIGSLAVVEAGGVAIAQHPASAEYPEMPEAAAALAPAHYVLNPEEIGSVLVRHVHAIRARAVAVTDQTPQSAEVPVTERRAGGVTIRVLLADDHRIVLNGLRVLLAGEPDFVVVAEAEDGAAAVSLAAEHKPDVVVMDLAMPGVDGIAATSRILARDPSVRVLVLSAHTDARATAQALKAGAVAVLSKQKAFEELITAVRTAMAGGVYVSRRGRPAETSPASVRSPPR